MNKRKVPKIRFKGFYDDWEQRKLGDVFMSLQNNTLSRAELNDEFGAAQSIHYGDVLIKYDEVLDVSKEPLSYIEKQSIADKFKTSYLQNGDVIIADTAEDETVGKCTEIEGLTDQKVISGLHTMPVRPNRKFASGFLGFYLNSAAYHDQLKPLMQGIKVTSISKGAMQDTVVKFPLDLKEQEQIGIYFSGIDNLITLHQRKLEKLKIIKKSMLENCFPKNGEKAPKIRFFGFSDDWEQRKLAEVTELKSASRVHKGEWTDSGIPFFRSSDVMAAINGTTNEKTYISEELYEKLSSASGKLDEGDVLVTGGGSVGNPYIVPNNEPLYTKDADLLWIKNQGRFHPYYLYEYFFSPTFRTYLSSISHVGTIAHYTITQLSETPIYFPNIEEQIKVGEYFDSLDHLITLHQSKLEKLKMIKKSMLETMFV